MTNFTEPTNDEIVALETAYWEAMKAKDGSETARLSGEVSLVTGPRGVTSIPKARMGQMTEAGDWTLESYQFDNIEVRIPAPNVAIIAYSVSQKVTMNGKAQDLRAADSSTWIKGANGWECHAHSEAFLQDEGSGQ